MDFAEVVRQVIYTKMQLDIQTLEVTVHRSIINPYEAHL
jgi:hypothetical protein